MIRQNAIGSVIHQRPVGIAKNEGVNPHRRLLIPLKNSFACPDRAYSLTLRAATPEGAPLPIPYITFDQDAVPLDSLPCASHIRGPSDARDDTFNASQREQARQFLHITLARGPLPSAQLQSEARSLGIAAATLARAKLDLRVHSFKTGIWFTTLPDRQIPDFQI